MKITLREKLIKSRLRAKRAVRAICSQARKNGLYKMSLRDINTLIKKTREERKR